MKLALTLSCFICLFNLIYAQTPIFEVNFEEISNSQAMEEVSGISLNIQNQFNNPESFESPFGKALRLDGHSTYIEKTGFDFNDAVSNQLAIEIWYATESFNQSSTGLIVQRQGNNGFTLKVRPFGKVLFQFYPDNQSYFIESDEPIPTYQWNHIIAQVNLADQLAEIYLNGILVGQKSLDAHIDIKMAPSDEKLLIGRDIIMPQTAGFITSTANGAIDQINIFSQTFTSNQINERFNQVTNLPTNLQIDPDVRHPNDYLRPRYHFMPNTSWANEAYGFTYYQNQYHLFFQKNPNAPILNFMHWGHLSSPDLVNWTEESMPLRPQADFSSVGTWSGTTFFNLDGEPVIAYTGVNGAFAGIGIAETEDSMLVNWNVIPQNPVIPSAPTSIPNQDFRDPYVWLEGNTYYMVVGSGKANNQGGILMSYKSTDYINWELIDPIFQTTASVGGRFWEMPYFNAINDTDYVLVVTPQFIGLPARTIYWVGTFENETFLPYHEQPKNFELLTRHLLSPAIGYDENGDMAYLGIIPEDRNVQDQIDAGWRQTFSIPRVLRLLDDSETLGHYPHPNLCRARQNEVVVENFTISENSSNNLPDYQGNQSELSFTIYNPEVEKFEIHVYKNQTGSEFTAITFNKASGKLGIDRTNSSPFNTVEDHQFRDYTFNNNDSIQVDIYLDHSILEVFVDNLVALSARVYPSEGSNLVDIVTTTPGELQVTKFEAWDISNKEILNAPQVCLPNLLPDDLFTTSSSDLFDAINESKVIPNPVVNNQLFIEGLDSNTIVTMIDFYGRQIQLNAKNTFLDISQLANGIYFGYFEKENQIIKFRFVKQ